MVPHYTLTCFPAGRDQRSTLMLSLGVSFIVSDTSAQTTWDIAEVMETELHRVRSLTTDWTRFRQVAQRWALN